MNNLKLILFFATVLNTSVAFGQAETQNPTFPFWKVNGNSGTNASTNFIGTADNQALVFKVNSQFSGIIDNSLSNTAFGYRAFLNNTTGSSNVAIGTQALMSNTNSQYNTACGYNSLKNATTSNNTGFGHETLSSTTTGFSNTATGANALRANTTGYANVASGYDALRFNTTGNSNVAIGYYAFDGLISGNNNTSIGTLAADTTTKGSNLTAVGTSTSFAYNLTNATALGYDAHVSQSNSLVLGSNANVGIGTSAPGAKLEVVGTTKTTNFQMTSGATNNYVLTSDATGNATWQPSGSASAWSLTGNSGTSSSTNFIGTTDNRSLRIRTNNTERVIIDSMGNVGLNAQPNTIAAFNTNRLEIWAEDGSRSDFLMRTANVGTPVINFYTHDGTLTTPSNTSANRTLGIIAANSQTNGSPATSSRIFFKIDGTPSNDAPGLIALSTTPAGSTSLVDRLIVNKDGYVGIGTYPSSQLHLSSAIMSAARITSSHVGGTWLSLENTGTGGDMWNVISTGSSNGEGAGHLLFRHNSSSGVRMMIQSGGNVGIGTTSPTAKLDVAGTTRTTNFQMTSGPTNNYVLTGDATGNGTWKSVTTSAWGLTGNSGTNASVNFLGTTDDVDLRFKRNNLKAGLISSSITFFGNLAGNANTGNENTGIGASALSANTSGAYNTAVGQNSLSANTTGTANVACGRRAMEYNTTGEDNTALGNSALRNNTTGDDNIAIGSQSMESAGGNYNIGIGTIATYYNGGNYNIGIGYHSLYNHGSGDYNTALGSLSEVYSGITNSTAIGAYAEAGASNTMVLGSINGVNGATASVKVGIGTTTPSNQFEVLSTNTALSLFSSSNVAGSWVGIKNTSTGGAEWNLISSGSGNGEGAGHILFRHNNNGVKMMIQSGGNVGIGTTSIPGESKLVIGGIDAGEGAQIQLNPGSSNSTAYFMDVNGNNLRVMTGSTSGSSAVRLTMDNSGKVAIGGSAPGYPLDVQTNVSTSYSNYGYLHFTGAGTVSGSSGSVPVSIRASDRIIAWEFGATSDKRIKNIIGRSNNTEDLVTLNKINITNYRFIDTLGKGNRVMKKVIAQELEEVYPNAVNKMTDVIPNIYSLAEIKNGIVTLKNDLKEGDTVKLIFAERTELIKILAATPTTFTVDLKDEGKVFVFGKQVSDLRTVDYEALTTLSVSAIQELTKRITILENENSSISELRSEMKELKELMRTQLQQKEAEVLPVQFTNR